MSHAGKWGYSSDEELYHGIFDTRDEAIIEAGETRPAWVGRYRDPIAAEKCVDGEDLIEKVLCQDDYAGEWAEGELDCNREQINDLTEAIAKTFGEWIDRHGLRPSFGIIEHAEKIV